MPHPFKSYEVEVLHILLAAEFSRERLAQLLEDASDPKIEYTNYGFYVSLKHSAVGKPRRVYDGSTTLSGDFDGKNAGFIAFLQDDHLTLETFPWDGEALPATFRDSLFASFMESRPKRPNQSMKPTQPLGLRPSRNPHFSSTGWGSYFFLGR